MKNIICRVQRLMLNNKGFSLTELLVAVVVLGIIVVPMLHTFVTGANTAAKSRKLGDATLAAQNISETIEANDLQDILKDKNTLFGPESTVAGTGGTYDVVINGITAGSSKFDAKVKLNAATVFSNINSESIAEYPKPDAAFVQGLEEDPDKISNEDFAAASETMEPFTPLTRSITLQLGYNDSHNITATLVYEYKSTYSTKVSKDQHWLDTIKYDLFPSGFSVEDNGGVMPNIYVMYNPWYSDEAGSRDYITVDNPKNIPLSVFLVKQRTAETEIRYDATIVLCQKSTVNGNVDDSLAKIYSNAKEKPENGTVSTGDVSYLLKIEANDGYAPIISAKFSGNEEGDLVPKVPQNRLFNVTIDICPEGSNTPLMTMNTAKLQIYS